MRGTIAAIMLLFVSMAAAAQIDTNQNAPGVRWKKINTPHFEIIFPEELTHEGQRVANTLEHLYIPLVKTLPVDVKRISILLTNQGAISNGYVALAPRMSEWFSPPSQSPFAGTIEWYNLLASHEGRHIIQFDKANQGSIHAARVLFGELGQMVLSMLAIPMWFWEGDAICMETALSHGGRGRMPAFDMEIRALLLSNERYSYSKAYFLSYKDWHPDHYHLGWLMTSYVRRKYGADIWSRIIGRTCGFSLYPLAFSFSKALKSLTGEWVGGIYNETMNELETLWREQLNGLEFTDAKIINTAQKKLWTNYVMPQYLPDGSIIAVRYGMAEQASIIQIFPDGTERTIKHFNPLTDISASSNRIAWDEARYDPRWTARSYSVIMTHSLNTGKTKQITKKTRFYAPSLSPDGRQIALVEFNAERKCFLVILDAEDGHEIKRFANPANNFIGNPSWSPDASQIAFTRQVKSGVAMTILDVDTGQMKDVIPYTWENIYYPSLYENYMLFNSAYSGIDNIHALDISTGQRYQVTSRKFGAFNPDISIDGKNLIFQDYTVDGYSIAEMPLEPSKWIPIDEVKDRSINYYKPLLAQENGENTLDADAIPNIEYEIENYNTLSNLLNFHSWYIMPTVPTGGAGIISNNKLNTLSTSIGLNYNVNEKVMSGGLDFSYAGYFPIFDAGISYGGRSALYDGKDGDDTWTSWKELSAEFGVRIPFTLTKGIYYTSLELGIGTAFTDISDKIHIDAFENGDGVFMPLTYSLEYSRIRSRLLRDIAPRWGQAARISYSHTPGKSDYDGAMFTAAGRINFPGLMKHHSIGISGAFEWQDPGNYRFESEISFPRGYDYRYHKELYRVSADYNFPILYPDLELGPLFYLKRIKGNLFYDHGIGRYGGENSLYNSIGIELSADFYMLSMPIPFDMGMRYSYRLKDNEYEIEPLFFSMSF